MVKGGKSMKVKEPEIDLYSKFKSVGIEEIKLKVMSKPAMHIESSCFIASKA